MDPKRGEERTLLAQTTPRKYEKNERRSINSLPSYSAKMSCAEKKIREQKLNATMKQAFLFLCFPFSFVLVREIVPLFIKSSLSAAQGSACTAKASNTLRRQKAPHRHRKLQHRSIRGELPVRNRSHVAAQYPKKGGESLPT